MPRKIRRAELYFIKSGPSGPHLRRSWRSLPVRTDLQASWPAPGLLAGRKADEEVLAAEVEQALAEQALLPIERISELPDDFNLVLFSAPSWLDPAAVVTGELIDAYRAAIEYRAPLLFEREALFGPFFWKLSDADELLDEEHLILEFLDAVDAERRRYERLMRRYARGEPRSESRRERIPEEVRVFVWRRDEGRCVQCGSQENLEFDHVIPVSRGGSSTARNIQLLCELCNRAKGAIV